MYMLNYGFVINVSGSGLSSTGSSETDFFKILNKHPFLRKCIWKYRLQNVCRDILDHVAVYML